MSEQPKLLVEFKGQDGRSIGLFQGDHPQTLRIAVIDADDEATAVVLPIAMVNALWGKLRVWTYEAVGSEVPTDRP